MFSLLSPASAEVIPLEQHAEKPEQRNNLPAVEHQKLQITEPHLLYAIDEIKPDILILQDSPL